MGTPGGESLEVIIPARGDPPWLTESLASLAAQTRPARRVTLVDDGLVHPGRVADMGSALLGSAFQLMVNPGQGISDAINAGVHGSSCEWIARMDADDRARPDRFDRQLAFLGTCPPEVAGCGTQAILISESGRPLLRTRLPVSREAIRARLGKRNSFLHPSLVLRREVLLEFPYRRVLDGAEDVDLVLRCCEKYPILNLDDALMEYRLHDGQESFAGRPRQTAIQELVIRLHRLRGAGIADPLDRDPGLVERFIDWRLRSPGYAGTRRFLTALRYVAIFLCGGDCRRAASLLRQALRGAAVERLHPGIVFRVMRRGGAALAGEPTPFPDLNLPPAA